MLQTLSASAAKLARPSWDRAKSLARDLLSAGDYREAFRIALSWIPSESGLEAAAFVQSSFQKAPLKFAMTMDEGIGNMIAMTPAIRAIKQMFPACEIEVVAKPPPLSVVRGWSAVAACTDLTSFDPSIERDAMLLSIWSGQFKQAYKVPLAAMSCPVLQSSLKRRLHHESEFHMDLARSLGFTGDMPEPYCAIETSELPFAAGEKVALLADTSNPDPVWQKKRWPYFRELAQRLIEMGFRVGLIGGQTEADAFKAEEWPKEIMNLCGKYSIAQTAYVIQQAGLIIANDSGPAHIGGVVGADTFVIFGPTTEFKNLPLGKRVHMIKTDLGCRPCQYLPSWKQCADFRCMNNLTVDQVTAALERDGSAVEKDASTTTAESKESPPVPNTIRVDLGCGTYKRKDCVGVDTEARNNPDVLWDVTQPLPFESDSVDFIACDHFLAREGVDLINVMNEIWRVCKANGRIEVSVPHDEKRSPAWERDFARFDASGLKWLEQESRNGLRPFQILSMHRLNDELEVALKPEKGAGFVAPAIPNGGLKPRLCFVTHNQPFAGGGEIAMHHLANRLVDCGYSVTAVYNSTPYIHPRAVETPSDARYAIQWVSGPNATMFQETAAVKLRELAPQIDVCLAICQFGKLMDECKAAGIVGGLWSQSVNYAPDHTNTTIFRKADFVIAVTPFARGVMKRRFGRTRDIYVIPNAADDVFFENYAERSHRRSPGPQRFLYFGRLADADKGIMTLCEGLCLLRKERPGFVTDIIGEGPERDAMRSYVGLLQLGENVRFLGRRPPGEIARSMRDYDLCILPSNYEACSLAVLEAMAAGLPVIATRVGGTPWLIEDGKHGILVRNRQPQELADAVKWAWDHPDAMHVMARWAHKRALREFHWDRVVRDSGDVFAQVFARKQAGN